MELLVNLRQHRLLTRYRTIRTSGLGYPQSENGVPSLLYVPARAFLYNPLSPRRHPLGGDKLATPVPRRLSLKEFLPSQERCRRTRCPSSTSPTASEPSRNPRTMRRRQGLLDVSRTACTLHLRGGRGGEGGWCNHTTHGYCPVGHGPSHPRKAETEDTGFSPTREALLAASEGREGGCTQFVHGRSRMTIDPRIPTMPGRSTLWVFTNQAERVGGQYSSKT